MLDGYNHYYQTNLVNILIDSTIAIESKPFFGVPGIICGLGIHLGYSPIYQFKRKILRKIPKSIKGFLSKPCENQDPIAYPSDTFTKNYF